MAYRTRVLRSRSPHSSQNQGKPGTGRRGTGNIDSEIEEVCEMQDAQTLLAIIHERGKKGLPLERVYRHLFKRDLYLMAYGRIYRNAGAMTAGSTPETVDEMSLAKIATIIEALRYERYRWRPTRRISIEKKH